ncbi:hypothetical protein LTR15_002228 [Elasticomyces elasticus]|nr:hypothetical protein LTR15_002228 [Elasticomyces elasticus]
MVVGDSTDYHKQVTAFYSDDSTCSNVDNSLLLNYEPCYNATDFTHFTVRLVNASPVSSMNGTDGTASPTTPVTADPMNSTGAAVPSNKDHGPSKAVILGPAIAIPLFFLFLVGAGLYIKFRSRTNESVRPIRGRRTEDPGSDEAPIDPGVPQNRSNSRSGSRLAESSAMINVGSSRSQGPLKESMTTFNIIHPHNPASSVRLSTMLKPKLPMNRDDFEIVILCALVTESDAVEELFEVDLYEQAETYRVANGDLNSYSFGMLGGKPVVVAYLRDM